LQAPSEIAHFTHLHAIFPRKIRGAGGRLHPVTAELKSVVRIRDAGDAFADWQLRAGRWPRSPHGARVDGGVTDSYSGGSASPVLVACRKSACYLTLRPAQEPTSARSATPSFHSILPGQAPDRKPRWSAVRVARRIHGFVALIGTKVDKNGLCARRAQRILGFVAQKRAKIGKTAFVARRIHRFVALIGAEFDKNGLCVQCMQRIVGFVARVWAKTRKSPLALQRIVGFVARVWAKTRKSLLAVQRIAGFVARVGAQRGKKVLCVQCMQRILGFDARPGSKMAKSPPGLHAIPQLG
jgi:hypothetical protein